MRQTERQTHQRDATNMDVKLNTATHIHINRVLSSVVSLLVYFGSSLALLYLSLAFSVSICQNCWYIYTDKCMYVCIYIQCSYIYTCIVTFLNVSADASVCTHIRKDFHTHTHVHVHRPKLFSGPCQHTCSFFKVFPKIFVFILTGNQFSSTCTATSTYIYTDKKLYTSPSGQNYRETQSTIRLCDFCLFCGHWFLPCDPWNEERTHFVILHYFLRWPRPLSHCFVRTLSPSGRHKNQTVFLPKRVVKSTTLTKMQPNFPKHATKHKCADSQSLSWFPPFL